MVAEAQSDATRVDRRTVLTGAAAAAGAALLPQPATAQSPRRGGTLRVAIPFNPGAIEPMTGRNLPDFNVLYAVFDNLIDFDPLTLDLKPGLATAWALDHAHDLGARSRRRRQLP